MGKINKLDSNVYNKISAGEVVERPASVVKELVENSIDAGATWISVNVFGGGLNEITIADNGEGISKEDLPVAFLPHATSKIKTVEDLFDINHLGFRGEALASIASVSNVYIKTKTALDEIGNSLEVNGGKVGIVQSCGANQGTVISVRNLFFNTPARLKFMKKPKGEENEITAIMTKLVLANPHVAFDYYCEGNKVFSSTGKGLYEALCAVYPDEIIDNLIEVNKTKGDFSIYGFVSNSLYSKGNRSYQTFILNGRVVNNQTISTAIQNSYSDYMMKRSYPVVALCMDMPTSSVDVNVHPAKSDVRFVDSSLVFGFIYSAIKDAIDKDNAQKLEFSFDNDNKRETENITADSVYQPSKVEEGAISNDIQVESSSKHVLRASESAVPYYIPTYNPTPNLAEEIKFDIPSVEEKIEQTVIEEDISYSIVGQAFGTYLFVEYKGELLIIDQHAAGERIIYNKLMDEVKRGAPAIQPLLLPYVFSVNSKECEILEEQIPLLLEIGIEITPFGLNAFKIDALPGYLVDIDFDSFVKDILSDSSLRGREPSVIKEKLAYTACHSAIRGNDYLNDEGIKTLIKSIFDAGLPLQCPHGRPAYVKFTKTELEKMFKRIV